MYPSLRVRTVIRADDRAALLLNLSRPQDPPVVLPGAMGRYWFCLLEGKEPPEAVKLVAECYGESPGRVEADIARCIPVLVQRGLMSPRRFRHTLPEVVATPDSLPAVEMVEGQIDHGRMLYRILGVFLLIPVHLLKRGRWDVMVWLLQTCRRIRPSVASDETAAELIHSLRWMGRKSPAKSACFETVVGAFLVGFLCGHPPHFCYGASFPESVQLHAWCEGASGQPIGEPYVRRVPHGAFVRI